MDGYTFFFLGWIGVVTVGYVVLILIVSWLTARSQQRDNRSKGVRE